MAKKKSDLCSSIWASCDELCGGLDASRHKDYALFMLFIKYITDKYGNSRGFTPLPQALFKDPERKRERLEELPLGRLATAEDVAEAVLYLVSPEAPFLNGVALPVDG
jgi:hypothetical protein